MALVYYINSSNGCIIILGYRAPGAGTSDYFVYGRKYGGNWYVLDLVEEFNKIRSTDQFGIHASAVGWYRLMEVKSTNTGIQGASTLNCNFFLGRDYNDDNNELYDISFSAVYQTYKFKINNSVVNHYYMDKIRYQINTSTGKGYIDVHYNNNNGNYLKYYIKDTLYMEPLQPYLVDSTQEYTTVAETPLIDIDPMYTCDMLSPSNGYTDVDDVFYTTAAQSYGIQVFSGGWWNQFICYISFQNSSANSFGKVFELNPENRETSPYVTLTKIALPDTSTGWGWRIQHNYPGTINYRITAMEADTDLSTIRIKRYTE